MTLKAIAKISILVLVAANAYGPCQSRNPNNPHEGLIVPK